MAGGNALRYSAQRRDPPGPCTQPTTLARRPRGVITTSPPRNPSAARSPAPGPRSSVSAGAPAPREAASLEPPAIPAGSARPGPSLSLPN